MTQVPQMILTTSICSGWLCMGQRLHAKLITVCRRIEELWPGLYILSPLVAQERHCIIRLHMMQKLLHWNKDDITVQLEVESTINHFVTFWNTTNICFINHKSTKKTQKIIKHWRQSTKYAKLIIFISDSQINPLYTYMICFRWMYKDTSWCSFKTF